MYEVVWLSDAGTFVRSWYANECEAVMAAALLLHAGLAVVRGRFQW